MAKLTDRSVQALKEGEIKDDALPGFGVRALKRTKTFVYDYRIDGRRRRLSLGHYPAISLADARRAAIAARAKVDAGIDPAREREDAKRARVDRHENTVAAVFATYTERYLADLRTGDEVERMLRENFVGRHGELPIADVRKRHVLDTLDAIARRGKAVRANRVLANLRRFFNWCVERDHIAVSPCAGIKPPGKEVSRERVLSDEELAALWRAAQELGYPWGPAFELLILTGQRRGEVQRMRWQDLDFTRGIWTIPAEFSKNGRTHALSLPAQCLAVIGHLPRMDDKPWVFPSLRARSNDPISGWGKAKRRLDELSAVTDWRIHDLRRTAASGMAALRVQPHVIERVLNHVTGQISGVAAVYNRHSYLDEMRAALEAWTSYVEELVDPGKRPRVVPLVSAARTSQVRTG